MSSTKGFQSPLERARFGQLGAPKPADQAQQEEETQFHTSEKTFPRKNEETQKLNTTMSTRKSDNQIIKRQTILMPQELALWLKIYAAKKSEDMSSIVTNLVQQLRNQEEGSL